VLGRGRHVTRCALRPLSRDFVARRCRVGTLDGVVPFHVVVLLVQRVVTAISQLRVVVVVADGLGTTGVQLTLACVVGSTRLVPQRVAAECSDTDGGEKDAAAAETGQHNVRGGNTGRDRRVDDVR